MIKTDRREFLELLGFLGGSLLTGCVSFPNDEEVQDYVNKSFYEKGVSFSVPVRGKSVQTHVVDLGKKDAPVIALMHGILFNSFVWRRNIEDLSKHYRVVAWDQVGSGKSEVVFPDDRVCCKYLAEHGESTLRELGIDRAHLVGHSTGGSVASCMALHNEGLAESLTLVDSAFCFSDRKKRYFTKIVKKGNPFREYPMICIRDEAFKKYEEGHVIVPFDLRESFAVAFRPYMYPNKCYKERQEFFYGLVESEFEKFGNYKEFLAKLDKLKPGLIYGEEDPVCDSDAVSECKRVIPSLRLFPISGVSHFPFEEKPEEFNEVLLRATGQLEEVVEAA
ncbi:MAG: alpha/beta hydrolase [Nanoarchaeota archaeon]|nr:alpha/beta hydrolase [Nanoarchaeota archaeon]